MKSNQALKIIGGIIGLGISSVITALLLTQDENESPASDPKPQKKDPLVTGIHVPITLKPVGQPSGSYATFPPGTPFALELSVSALPGEGSTITFDIQVTQLRSGISTSVPPTPIPVPSPKPPPISFPPDCTVTPGGSVTIPMPAIPGTMGEQYFVVILSANSVLPNVDYGGGLLVTISSQIMPKK